MLVLKSIQFDSKVEVNFVNTENLHFLFDALENTKISSVQLTDRRVGVHSISESNLKAYLS